METMRESNIDNGWRSKHKIHPATELFPLMSQDNLAALATDIEANGLKVAIQIRTVDGVEYLIDGRNRMDALEALGRTVPDNMIARKEATFMEILSDVTSLNLKRRQLNQTQIGVIGEQMCNLEHGSNRYRAQKVETSRDASKTLSRAEAAKILGVGRSTIERVRRVKREAPHLFKPMQEGTLTAVEAIKKIKERQRTEKRVEAKAVQPTIMVHENICSADRIMSKPLERIYNSISHHKWGLFHFLVRLDKELGRGRLRAIAIRAEGSRLSEEKMRAKILAEQNGATRLNGSS
jgi:transposase